MTRLTAYALAAGLWLLAGPVAAMPRDGSDLVQVFAVCIGRYSAMLEHQWIAGSPDAAVNADRRAAFQDLLEAVMADTEARRGASISDVLLWRVGARSAQAQLLRLSARLEDPGRATRARTIAFRQLRLCERLLPG